MSNTLFRTVKLAVDGRTVGVSLPYGVQSSVSDDGAAPYWERFEPGVFARSVIERRSKVRLLSVAENRAVPVGAAVDLQEDQNGLFAAFSVAESRDGESVLALIGAGATGVIGLRPLRDRRDGDVLVRLEAALVDVRVLGAPQQVIARSVAERRLALLDLEPAPW